MSGGASQDAIDRIRGAYLALGRDRAGPDPGSGTTSMRLESGKTAGQMRFPYCRPLNGRTPGGS